MRKKSKKEFWERHNKLDVAFKIFHWSLATIILVGMSPAILFVVVTFGFNDLPIKMLYGFGFKDC